jgi:hypothetical protein
MSRENEHYALQSLAENGEVVCPECGEPMDSWQDVCDACEEYELELFEDDYVEGEESEDC